MPPRTQFTREQIIDAAFEIYRKDGPDGLTSRRIAEAMSSSVGPIYTSFDGIDELQRALNAKALSLMDEYSRRQWTEMPFLNMGAGFIFFARDEPVLFRECYIKGIMGDDPLHPDGRTLERMREDPLLADLPDDELSALYIKLSFITFGMAILASAGQLPDASDGTMINILFRTGGDLIFMAKARKLLADRDTRETGFDELRRYFDEHD